MRSVRESAPWLPVLVVGDPGALSAEGVIDLVEAGVTGFVAPEKLDESEHLRAAVNGQGQLVGQVLAALRRHYEPRPLPAELVQVIEVALERRPGGRLDVEELARLLDRSKATLQRVLEGWGAPPAGRVLSWCQVLWAVHDLTTDPGATAESVAFELGCSSSSALGRVLFGCLGTRTRGARAMGLEEVIARFVAEFAVRRGPADGPSPRG